MRLIFAGTPEIAAAALSQLAAAHQIALVITRPDSEVGRKKILTPSAVATRATELGIKVIKTNSIGEVELAKITEAAADRAIVVAYGSLIPKPALNALPWWNLHFSRLPQWRGATPLQHSMMMRTGIGITVFELEAGLDTGPIIAQQDMSVSPTETALEALSRFTERGTELILASLESSPTPTAQVGEASHAPKISRGQARINQQASADSVAAIINALNPEPVAWAEMAGEPVRLLRANSVQSELVPGLSRSPGDIWKFEQRVLLTCKQGTFLELLEVQPAGKKPMSAGDWFRGLVEPVRFD